MLRTQLNRYLSISFSALIISCGQISSLNEGGKLSQQERIDASRELALEWAEKASNETSSERYLTKISELSNVLEERDIIIVKDQDGPCADNTYEEFTLAYVLNPPQNSDIYVCKESFEFENAIIAQVLVHEGIHITGETNECETTDFEVNITHLAGVNPFKNVYVDSTSDPDCSYLDLNHISFVTLTDDGESARRPIQWNSKRLPKGLRY